MHDPEKGLLIVISGPSGVGKGTICRELFNKYDDIIYSVSTTTRKPRPGEVEGKHYFFTTEEEFQKLIAQDAFLEWAQVYGNYYGTPRQYVEEILQAGKDCILEIDIQGALQVKQKMPEGIFIFVVPPSLQELIRRITCRGTEDPSEIEKRMSQVSEEMSHLQDYDYIVVNDEVPSAVEQVRAIIVAERCRSSRMCKLINMEV
ncbi:MAG: guanylate kinase [Bacillota bacterium]|uniref:Guanylate kinase n=1 Tax=Thermanaerosceptrum fracticalcis TaxID=1712410 RepID=A0A7G6E1P5_THEFR|nr:guanylate kinase [Thermanaerosceptrum fracticalcis]QNB45999.1 guanylate kinase [Thermanaerosceptrum fracticalcis]